MAKMNCAANLLTIVLSLVAVVSGKICTKHVTDEVSGLTNVKIIVCCEGYLEVSRPGSEVLECQPICEPPCGHGTCYSPKKCACDEGYRHSKLGTCIPIEGVIPPTMTTTDGPNVIECRLGYVMDKEGICQPTCEPPCGNGVCYSPNRCACDEGFKHSKVGSCVANETLTIKSLTAVNCVPGYQMTAGGACIPVEDAEGSSANKAISWKWYPLIALIAAVSDSVLHLVV